MKYIRMEDGIFNTYNMFINMLKEFKERDWDFTTIKIEQKYGEKTLSCRCKCFNSSIPYEITVQFVNQADTLEELIDDYVAIYPKNPELNRVIDSEYFFSHESSEGEYEYYGSIWVDGNLIKVAKKNKERELCLL